MTALCFHRQCLSSSAFFWVLNFIAWGLYSSFHASVFTFRVSSPPAICIIFEWWNCDLWRAPLRGIETWFFCFSPWKPIVFRKSWGTCFRSHKSSRVSTRKYLGITIPVNMQQCRRKMFRIGGEGGTWIVCRRIGKIQHHGGQFFKGRGRRGGRRGWAHVVQDHLWSLVAQGYTTAHHSLLVLKEKQQQQQQKTWGKLQNIPCIFIAPPPPPPVPTPVCSDWSSPKLKHSDIENGSEFCELCAHSELARQINPSQCPVAWTTWG